MTEVASRVILPTTIWFSVSHLADWLITESGCSLAARAHFHGAPRFAWNLFVSHSNGRVCQPAEWHINQAFAKRSPPLFFYPRSLVLSREGSRLSRRGSPRYLSDGSGTGESCHGHFGSFRNPQSIKSGEVRKEILMHQVSGENATMSSSFSLRRLLVRRTGDIYPDSYQAILISRCES